MDDRTRKQIYETVSTVLSLAFFASLFGMIYSHRWIMEFEGPTSELVMLMSDSTESEYELMQSIRLVSGLLAVSSFAVFIVLSSVYEELVENLQRELIEALVVGMVAVLIGASVFVYASDLVIESIGLTFAVAGTIFNVLAAYNLAIGKNDKQ